MIRVYKIVDKIAEKCFTQEEKALLEFEVGSRRITIASQFKYYYSKACWEGEEEDLYDAICIRKEEKKELLKKIQSLNERISTAIDPAAYDDVFVRIEGTKRTGTNININTEGNNMGSSASGTTTSDDKSDSWSVGGSRTAIGEMDEVNTIDDVWRKETLNHASVVLNQPQNPKDQVSATISEPSITKGDDAIEDIKYRHFNLVKSSGEDVSRSFSIEKAARSEESSATSSSTGIGVNKSQGDRNVGGRRFKTGEQLVNIWKDEIPNLRNKFWLIFHGLFIYERDY